MYGFHDVAGSIAGNLLLELNCVGKKMSGSKCGKKRGAGAKWRGKKVRSAE
jgi:hypothetical protein